MDDHWGRCHYSEFVRNALGKELGVVRGMGNANGVYVVVEQVIN